jgi:hypothetical protein
MRVFAGDSPRKRNDLPEYELWLGRIRQSTEKPPRITQVPYQSSRESLHLAMKEAKC